MRHILRLTSSLLFLLFLSCSPVHAQESLGAGKDPEPFDKEVPDGRFLDKEPGSLSMGIFYNPCMNGISFAEVIHRTKELPVMRMPSQQHGEQASIQVFVNEQTETYTVAIMNTTLSIEHPQKICILASGTGFKYLKNIGMQI